MTFRNGDAITCKGGHLQGRFTRDGRQGEPITGEDFAAFASEQDGSGYACDQPHCGEPVAIRLEDGHWCVHTPNGWLV